MTRLIDADALKEEINKKRVVGRFNTIQLIDNAPTVEPPFAYQCGYEAGLTEAKPIGEDILQQAWERGYKYGLYEAEQKHQVKIMIGGEQVYPEQEAENERS